MTPTWPSLTAWGGCSLEPVMDESPGFPRGLLSCHTCSGGRVGGWVGAPGYSQVKVTIRVPHLALMMGVGVWP